MYFTHFTHLPISHAHAHPHQCVPREILMHFDVLNMLIRTTSTLLRLILYFDPFSYGKNEGKVLLASNVAPYRFASLQMSSTWFC